MDEKTQKKINELARKWEEQDKRAVDEAIKALVQLKEGRMFLYWLLDIGMAIGTNAFATNAMITAFNCGQQNVGNQVLGRLCEVAPDSYLQMLKEISDERNTRNAAIAKYNNADSGRSDAEPGDSGEP